MKSASKNKQLGNEKIHPIAIFNDTLVDSLISEKYIDSINVSKPSLSFNRLDLQIDNYFIKLSSYFLCIVLFLLIFPITLFFKEKEPQFQL